VNVVARKSTGMVFVGVTVVVIVDGGQEEPIPVQPGSQKQ